MSYRDTWNPAEKSLIGTPENSSEKISDELLVRRNLVQNCVCVCIFLKYKPVSYLKVHWNKEIYNLLHGHKV